MYILRHRNKYGQKYLKYDGWVEFTDPEQSLDLSDCILFTKGEAEQNRTNLPMNYEFIWYGAYKR